MQVRDINFIFLVWICKGHPGLQLSFNPLLPSSINPFHSLSSIFNDSHWQPVATGQTTSWLASSLPLRLQSKHLRSRCLQVVELSLSSLWLSLWWHSSPALLGWVQSSFTALNPFYAGWHPPSPAWSSWASARTCCWLTPPYPQLPGQLTLITKLTIKSLSLSDNGRWVMFEDWYHFQMIHSVNSGTWLSWQALTSTVAQSKFPLVVLESIW